MPRNIILSDDEEEPALVMATSSDDDDDDDDVLNWDTLSQDASDDDDAPSPKRSRFALDEADCDKESVQEDDEITACDESSIVTLSLTLTQLYKGCVRRVHDGTGAVFLCCIPPKTPPNRLLCGGRIRVVRSDASNPPFSVDKEGYLTRTVQVPMLQALCGQGTVRTTTPDGSECSVTLTKEVVEGDRLVFPKVGFLDYRMYGTVQLVRSGLTRTQRDRIWDLLN